MPAVILTTPGAKAWLDHNCLKIEVPGEEDGMPPVKHSVHLHEIDQLVIAERCHITLPSLAKLLRRDVPVTITSAGEEVIGLCLPPDRHGATRLEQYRRSVDGTFALDVARRLVEAKILNSRRVLQRLAGNRPDREVTPHVLALGELAKNAMAAASLETLRGIEGTAAGRYFESYGEFYAADCPFERRSRRPPQNAANAVLSYCYTIVAAEIESAIHAVGLDPALGLYHQSEDLRPSLALDLLEPFRAPFADAMALDLISHQTLQARAHFERRDGGVFLNGEGKKRFFVGFERRIEREFTSDQHGGRTSIRGELRRQALSLKRAILENVPFEAFRMN